ncbi:pyrroloquinoline quinone biosynthesis peptide chaperone PqqD [Hoeflea ulvae]|uniref:Pyrroloquinoline quinone biosynthesis peptide chaperone PqqD n=1 Tax=Hoeflea ulvae TaxID=2983764 RepID=A0ABT3YD60_9HYPH|nr:pyrroloquinoline quinone biosynthesis peptide chaperone PqqD [Hoeflea ulvae]MCY0093820.1 pyrroloquinoline quinone biosynthesis peptide chaperone PqqD [Hoeflea ulvae]
MNAGVRPVRPIITAQSVPFLPRHVILRHDKLRARWLILVPERVLVPEDTAVAVLQLVDGQRSVADIAAELAAAYTAPVDLILADSIALLQDLADKGFMATVSERT